MSDNESNSLIACSIAAFMEVCKLSGLDPVYASASCIASIVCIDASTPCEYSSAMNFHKRIRKLRKERDLSYQAIATECGVSWQTVQQWCKEEGGTYPKVENLETLAGLLGTTPWFLLWGVDHAGNLSNTDQNSPLSEGAEDLIRWVTRLDGIGDQAKKFFPILTQILQVADSFTLPQNETTGIDEFRRAEKDLSEAMKEGQTHAPRRKAR
jgi:transcriptional regulator with XRE-family HTH domain